jgi:DNA-binding transcriptional ArsR family regulator
MEIIDIKKGQRFALPTKELSLSASAVFKSPLAQDIIEELKKGPLYAKEIARKLKLHEQKIYYHIRKLEEVGVITLIDKEEKYGGMAKRFALSSDSFFLKLRELQPVQGVMEPTQLPPFVVDGKLNALIVVGSPDPHGPNMARSRDFTAAIDFALQIGMLLRYPPKSPVRIDTELTKEELRQNLIIIGGPIVHKITTQINDKLPVRFEEKNIFSSITEKTYTRAATGLIVRCKNPYSPNHEIVVLAGKRFSGTQAAIKAFQMHAIPKIAMVVEGADSSFSGQIDKIEILEEH